MPKGDALGLKRRRRVDGSYVFYWAASDISRQGAKNYRLKTIRLPNDETEAIARCRVLTAEFKEWLNGRDGSVPEDTIAGLIWRYQNHPYSPYRKVRDNTRRQYDESLGIIRRAVGGARIEELTADDFYRWYEGFLHPTPDTPRLRRAHNCIKLLRIVTGFGASMKYAGCADASMILSHLRFELPPPRRKQLSFDQAKAIIDKALEIGRPSIALAQALQFELSLRQKDVIGEWLDRRWANGVLWSDLSRDMVLTKQTTKTGAIGRWPVQSYPLIMRALEAFAGDRAGPMIVSETTGLPFRPDDFRVKWREIAKAAGVPDDIWNMDSRAGGITEGANANVPIDDLRRHATHTNAAMTARYMRDTLPTNQNVATLRVASRKKEGE